MSVLRLRLVVVGALCHFSCRASASPGQGEGSRRLHSSARRQQQRGAAVKDGGKGGEPDCRNGMYNPAWGSCDCIPPFCHDAEGVCNLPTDDCGGNPWEDCRPGEDCPWWASPLKAESCATGSKVPVGIYTIFPTKAKCCQTSHPESKFCDPDPITSKPTQSPVPEPQFDDLYEVVPIRFGIKNLPDAVDIMDLKAEMFDIFKRILADLTDRVGSVKITNLEEMADPDIINALRRTLKRNVDVYYEVTVVRDPNRSLGPIIIKWIRDSYDEVIERIREYTNREYFGTDIDMNWCTAVEDGQFSMCNDEVIPVKARLKDVDGIVPEDLASRLANIYKEILVGIDDIDVTTVKVKDILRDPEGFLDVFLDVHVVQKYGKDQAPAITKRIEGKENEILGEIQRYSDEATGSTFNWCHYGDAFTTCKKEVNVLDDAGGEPKTGLPLWAIILMSFLGVLFGCLVCCCIVAYSRSRSEEKNEVNMTSYIHTGSGVQSGPRKSAKYRNKSQPTALSFQQRYQPRRQNKQSRRHSNDKYFIGESGGTERRPSSRMSDGRRRSSGSGLDASDRQRRRSSGDGRRRSSRRRSSASDIKLGHSMPDLLDTSDRRRKSLGNGRRKSSRRRSSRTASKRLDASGIELGSSMPEIAMALDGFTPAVEERQIVMRADSAVLAGGPPRMSRRHSMPSQSMLKSSLKPSLQPSHDPNGEPPLQIAGPESAPDCGEEQLGYPMLGYGSRAEGPPRKEAKSDRRHHSYIQPRKEAKGDRRRHSYIQPPLESSYKRRRSSFDLNGVHEITADGFQLVPYNDTNVD